MAQWARSPDGIAECAYIDLSPRISRRFVGMRSLHQAQIGQGGENPGEFRDLRDILLKKERRLLGIQAKSQETHGRLHLVLTQEGRVLCGGHRMVAGDEVEGLVGLLKSKRRLNHAL